jgi:hypothetical protein
MFMRVMTLVTFPQTKYRENAAARRHDRRRKGEAAMRRFSGVA